MRIAALSAVAFAATTASAASIDIDVQNFTAKDGISEVVMKVNNLLPTPVTNVFIDCAFLNSSQKAVDIGKAFVSSIEAGGYAYAKAAIPTTDDVKFVDCRVTKYR